MGKTGPGMHVYKMNTLALSDKTMGFLQKICYKRAATVDMTQYGFISKASPINFLLRPLKDKLEKICGPSKKPIGRSSTAVLNRQKVQGLPKPKRIITARPKVDPERKARANIEEAIKERALLKQQEAQEALVEKKPMKNAVTVKPRVVVNKKLAIVNKNIAVVNNNVAVVSKKTVIKPRAVNPRPVNQRTVTATTNARVATRSIIKQRDSGTRVPATPTSTPTTRRAKTIKFANNLVSSPQNKRSWSYED